MSKKKEAQAAQTKSKEVVRRWRLGDYIRQLSVVILGIMVTFWGGDAIGEYSKKKEIRSVMGLVKEELILNQERLADVELKLNAERKMAKMLRDNNFNYQEIPEDTLGRYILLLNRTYTLSTTKDAMEVLKASGLAQHITDKRFVLSLSKTYGALTDAEEGIAGYHNLKNVASAAMAKVGIYYGENTKEFYGYCLNFNEWKSFIQIAPGYFDPDAFSHIQALLTETIQTIEEKYE